MSPVELRMKRRQTEWFIFSNPVSITLMRSTIVDDGAGGRTKSDPVALPPQEFKFVEKAPSQSTEIINVSGEVDQPDITLIGRYDADIQDDDRFTFNGTDYEVTYVKADRSYETWAEVKHG